VGQHLPGAHRAEPGVCAGLLLVPAVLPQRAQELGEAARIDGASEWRIFDGQISKVSYNLLMAGSLIAVVPVLAVALVTQRRVVEGAPWARSADAPPGRGRVAARRMLRW
jgi:hypothetical protein